jgi:hypothetical protein
MRAQLGEEAAAQRPPPGRSAKELLGEKDRWLRACPQNEYVWYAILRAAELTAADGKAPSNLIESARQAAPLSPWIETVYARSAGTVEAARGVARRWPRHGPAQVALAAAYERSGDLNAALAVLQPLLRGGDLDQIVGGGVLLARVALALGDLQLAVQAARTEPHGLSMPVEPVAGMLQVDEAFAIDAKAREAAHRRIQDSSTRASPIYQPQCPGPNNVRFAHRLLGATSRMEPQRPGEKAREYLHGSSKWWLHDCPHEAMVWYTVVRASELLSQNHKAADDLLDAARKAAPDSVWIETVRARALGTVEAAESALRLDRNHVPARIALAAAYERSGGVTAAMGILRAIPFLDHYVGASLLMARMALATGDVRLAAETASRETDDPSSHFEPVSSMDQSMEGARFSGDAWMSLHDSESALTEYLRAWSLGDSRLMDPPEDLRRAMERRFTNPTISPETRERLRGYLGIQKLRQGKPAAGVGMLVQSAAYLGDGFATDALRKGGPDVRAVLEKLRKDAHLSRKAREVVEALRSKP